jgi:hypothetical protein
MATLDVSDVPVCPEFADWFQVMSRPETITEFGRSSTSQVIAQAQGTIYPTGDNALVRQADYETNRKTITIVTPYRLKGASPGFQPDQIMYRGTLYVVSNVEDYSQYGQGIVVAQCSTTVAVPNAPQA